jgi:hypothetical protein
MPEQDINFSSLTSVIHDGVGLTEVIFNDTTVFTDPNPILGVGLTNAVSVDAGIRLPDYKFSINWEVAAPTQKNVTYYVIVRVYDSAGSEISGSDITHSFTTPLLPFNAQGTEEFSGSFGTLTNTNTTNAFIAVAGTQEVVIEDSLTVLSPTA